ncbi:hypothetical protein AOLI_G00295200 [Acnodon oligacanthus]
MHQPSQALSSPPGSRRGRGERALHLQRAPTALFPTPPHPSSAAGLRPNGPSWSSWKPRATNYGPLQKTLRVRGSRPIGPALCTSSELCEFTFRVVNAAERPGRARAPVLLPPRNPRGRRGRRNDGAVNLSQRATSRPRSRVQVSSQRSARRASRKHEQAVAFAEPEISLSSGEEEEEEEEEGSSYHPLSSSHATPGAALLAQTRRGGLEREREMTLDKEGYEERSSSGVDSRCSAGPAAPGSSCTERAGEKKQGRRALHSLRLCRGLHMSRGAKPCLYQSAAAAAETHEQGRQLYLQSTSARHDDTAFDAIRAVETCLPGRLTLFRGRRA